MVKLIHGILQLAIQGKLVDQRPEEGTAEDLYRQIQAEKQALIKAGKLKKEKPLPEITEDEKPFDIPESWMWVRLGDSFCIEMGQSPDGSSVSENKGGIEFHQGKVYFGELTFTSLGGMMNYYTPEHLYEMGERVVLKN